MPVIPGDDDKEMKEQLSQGAKEANAAQEERKSLGNVATSDDYKGDLGPVITENLPEPESKEELKKRSEELNKGES